MRAYQAALPPETLRALDGAGGSEPSVAGVWGAAGAPPPADVAFDVPYELPRAPTPPAPPRAKTPPPAAARPQPVGRRAAAAARGVVVGGEAAEEAAPAFRSLAAPEKPKKRPAPPNGGGGGAAKRPAVERASSSSDASSSSAAAAAAAAAKTPPKKPKAEKKKPATLPLRQPDLENLENPDMPMLRQEMIDNGHTAESPPRLHESIHPSLVPNETWKRPRQNGSSSGPHMDAYYICHLCSETTCLFDPHASVHPYYTEGPPGFNSTKQLEAHLMEMHCLPFPTPPSPPAPVPALEAAPAAARGRRAPPPAAEAAVRKTERQLAKERARRGEGEGEVGDRDFARLGGRRARRRRPRQRPAPGAQRAPGERRALRRRV